MFLNVGKFQAAISSIMYLLSPEILLSLSDGPVMPVFVSIYVPLVSLKHVHLFSNYFTVTRDHNCNLFTSV